MKNNKRKRRYIIILIISLCVVAIPSAYSFYQEKMDVNIITTTGDLICDVLVDTNENYIENNEAYFFVTVNNWKQESGKTILTSTDIDYNLVIENQEGSNGLYRYIDEDGNTNEIGEEKVIISDQHLGKEKASKKYKIFVTTNTNLKTDINFKVNLDANQRDMN